MSRYVKILTADNHAKLEVALNQFLDELTHEEQLTTQITVNPNGMRSAVVIYDSGTDDTP